MVSPQKTISTYRQILHYLSDKLGMNVTMVQRKNYADMDELLKSNNVQIAMICSGPYVIDHEEFGVELLVAPVMYGKSFYHAYIIASIDANIDSLEGLRGKEFAFTDPKSNTGYIVPSYMLAKQNENPDSFFSKYVYSGHHSRSIEMVAQKIVDGAAVDQLVWEYMKKTSPDLIAKTKVVTVSPEYGMPPIVVHSSMDSKIKERIRNIFLEMHKDDLGWKVLEKIHIDRFTVPKDENYDSVRDMINWIEKQ